MPHFKYVIVGAGMTAAAAVQGIRALDPSRLTAAEAKAMFSAMETAAQAAKARMRFGQTILRHTAKEGELGCSWA